MNIKLPLVLDSGGNLQQLQTGDSIEIPTASTSVLGGVKVDGTSITISGGTISATGGGGGGGSVNMATIMSFAAAHG